MIEAGYFK